MGSISISPPENLPALSSKWHLRPNVVHLDHGSSGACSTEVLEHQNSLRKDLDCGSPQYFMTHYGSGLAESKKALADFINADSRNLILTPGTTLGLNIVAQSLKFSPGDELLTTQHAYSSVTMLLSEIAARHGAKLIIAKVPFPVTSSEEILQSILAYTTPRTKFAIIDHIVSRTGLIFPIKRIVSELATRGIDVLVDGAHGPGQVHLDITDIGAAYYSASCHKWMCAPRGLGFLHVREDRVNHLRPLIIARSCYYRDTNPNTHSWLEHTFDWMGTVDPTAMHTMPRIINFLQTALPEGHSAMIERNHNLAVEARRQALKILDLPSPCPEDLFGNLVSIPLPDSILPYVRGTLPLQKWLWDEHHVEIQVYSWPAYPKRVLRFSCQLYNSLEQYIWLSERVKEGLQIEEVKVKELQVQS